MAKLPTVAIIGRPNAGKSTLFNALTGSKQAIVSDVAGTTRDHVASRVNVDIPYLLIDTGGIGGGSDDRELEDDVAKQSLIALEEADVILFAVNIRDELTASDRAVADILRRKRKRHVPVIIALTKADSDKMAERLPEFYALGIGDTMIPVSAVQMTGMHELREAIAEQLAALHFQAQEIREATDAPRIAIVGKPNVGKSSLINAYMSEGERKRSPRLVSDIPGTTRDPSDTIVKHEGKEYVFVDTAGMRRKAKIDMDIEEMSYWKSVRAIGNSDIVVLVLDSPELVSRQEKRIAVEAIEAGKGLVLFLNKSDLLTNAEQQERLEALRYELSFCTFAPVVIGSAKTREGLLKLFPILQMVHENMHRRLSVQQLRRWYDGCTQRLPARALVQGKHITQAKDIPPTFVLFTRGASDMQTSNLRFLERSLRHTFAFDGVPIRWVTKEP